MGNLHLVTGHAGKGHVTSADHGSLNASIFGTGQYVLNRGNKFAATVVSNNIIRIADGDILLQGRHIRLNENSYVDLTIENGAQDMLRNDLIVARYSKDSTSGVEDCNLVVIKGTAVEVNPADPDYIHGDIMNNHDLTADMPLYRVPLDGLNVQELVPLFEEGGTTVADNAVTTEKLAKGAVTTPKIANNSITKEKFAEGAVLQQFLFIATLPAAAWNGTAAPYTQTIAVEGIKADDKTDADVLLTDGNETAELEAWGYIGRIDTAADSITVTCFEDVPAVDLNLQIKVVR